MSLRRWMPYIIMGAALLTGQVWGPWAAAGIIVGGGILTRSLSEEITMPSYAAAAAGGAGLRANTCSTQEPLKVLYGQLRIGGNDVYMTTVDKNKNTLWAVQTLSEGECEGIVQVDGVDQLFLGDLLYNEYGGIISLVSSKYKWTASGGGTNEYYCELSGDGDPNLKEPSGLKINDVLAEKGTLGSLSAGEWGWGDNDSLNFDTVYVRLSDGSDPDIKSEGYIKTAGNVVFYFHNGSSSQAMDTNLNAASEEWTDPLRYTAYIVWKLVYDKDYFQSLPKRTIVLKGRKLYDFRDASTAYSNNPVLALYDYMTNARYGLGIAAAKFDTGAGGTWRAAADYCDTKGWTLNMLLSQDEAAQDIIDAICAHFRAELIWWAGKFYLRYADLNDESSCMTLEDKHIFQDENGKAAISISEPSQFKKADGLRVKYIDPDRGYIVDDFIVGDETGVIKELQLLGCTNRQQAADLGVYNLERQDLGRTVKGLFRDDALKLEPHDIVTLNTSALAISDQLMRVQEANIQSNNLIELTLMYEQLSLYDDDYNFDAEGSYQCVLPDPKDEPPSVSSVQLTEETYNYRLRTFTRLKVAFNKPATYAWYDHVEVWISYDDANWEHLFDCTSDFEIDPVEEGTTYYIRLKVVSIWDTKQKDNNDYKTSRTIGGYSDAPASLSSLKAVVNANTINLYAEKVSDPDVELYEFRLGSGWSGAIFLAALRSPNLSLYGVKPGNHTFLANTLGNNGLYGSTPHSAGATLKDPPDGWSVQATESIDTLITNGNMEADANWSNYGTPTTNERSSVQKHQGTYSRRFVSDAAGDGIKGDSFTTVNSGKYGVSLWVYPDDATKVRIKVRKGDDSGDSYDTEHTGLTQDAWNEIFFTFTEGAATGGASAYIAIYDGSGDTGSWYVDDVVLMQGEYTNMTPTLYSDEAHIKCRHSGSLTGTYKSPIFDQGSSARYLLYLLADIAVTGIGTTWDDVIPSPKTWDDINISTRTWIEIFELVTGPSVKMKVKYGESSPPTNEVEKMEILSAIATGQYFQIEIAITDPSDSVNALVENCDLKFCQ